MLLNPVVLVCKLIWNMWTTAVHSGNVHACLYKS